MQWKIIDGQEAVFAVAFGIIIWLVYHFYQTYQLHCVPGPFIAKFTNLHRFFLTRRGHVHLYQARAHQKYGPVVRFGPNMSKMYRAFRPWTPNGQIASVFSAEDDAANRHMKQPVAVYYSLSYTVSSFEKRVDAATQMLLDQLNRQYVATGTSFDLTRWFRFYSYDVMALMTFSHAYGYLQHGSEFSSIMGDVRKSMSSIAPMSQIPWLDWLLHKNRVVNFVKREAMSALLTFVLARIAERRNSLQAVYKTNVIGPDADGDFLGYFIQAMDKKSEQVPLRYLIMWVVANVMGGSDSSAAILRSVICLLAEHPDALESVRTELRNQQRTATGLSLPLPKWHELQNLPFLDACINETFRLEPPFALTLERVVPAQGATICGRFFPGGTIVGMNPYVTNRHRPTWGEDADVWRPRRWLEGDSAHIRRLEASLLTFGAGTRICLGQHVAMFEIKKLLAALIMNYDIDLVEPRAKVDRYSWIIMPESVQATIRKWDKPDV
ncbi:hypothetical protein CDD81_1460 [Ophiocordyceps australis]|uniref:Cytochrome P450 n=1 Tax=Ophiocordyceps australis TaxID=1399860 RepID=A0A2C5YDQ0_9HYPO|nr:hypothetical protein CDD81_1460 [Ophiocordyceps australis]